MLNQTPENQAQVEIPGAEEEEIEEPPQLQRSSRFTQIQQCVRFKTDKLGKLNKHLGVWC
jgi:hypothetical protein